MFASYSCSALVCVPSWFGRRCSNSQGGDPRAPEVVNRGTVLCARSAKQPGSGTLVPRVLPLWQRGWWPCCPVAANSQGWGAQDPKRPVGRPFPRSLCSTRSPWASLPLFRLRPPLPCPCAAAMSRDGVAGLLPWWLVSTGKCGCLTLLSSLLLQLQGLLPPGSSPLMPGACTCPCGPLAAFCTSPAHLHVLALSRCFVPVTEMPALHVPVRAPGPNAMFRLSHGGWLDASR